MSQDYNNKPQQKFSIGEEVILINCFAEPRFNGKTVMVLSNLHWRTFRRGGETVSAWVYEVDYDNCISWVSEPHQLMKKHKRSDMTFDHLIENLNSEMRKNT